MRRPGINGGVGFRSVNTIGQSRHQRRLLKFFDLHVPLGRRELDC